jgi:hypothetical protein
MCYPLAARNLGRRPLGLGSPTIRKNENALCRAFLIFRFVGIFCLTSYASFEDAGYGLTFPPRGGTSHRFHRLHRCHPVGRSHYYSDFSHSADFGRLAPPDYTDAIRTRCRLMGCKTTTSIFEADLLAQPKDPHEPATVSPSKGLPSA